MAMVRVDRLYPFSIADHDREFGTDLDVHAYMYMYTYMPIYTRFYKST